jgi:hypothetical protein
MECTILLYPQVIARSFHLVSCHVIRSKEMKVHCYLPVYHTKNDETGTKQWLHQDYWVAHVNSSIIMQAHSTGL